jgi:putative FmdB family regulatory protein
MPIYEYRCRRCQHVWEAIRPMGDEGETLECPECGRRGPELIPSVFAAATGKPAGAVGAGASCSGCSKASCSGCGSA